MVSLQNDLLLVDFLYKATAASELYVLSLHDALPIFGVRADEPETAFGRRLSAHADRRDRRAVADDVVRASGLDRKSTRLNSSHRCISYAVFCWKKKKLSWPTRCSKLRHGGGHTPGPD